MMISRTAIAAAFFAVSASAAMAQAVPLSDRIAIADPETYNELSNVHAGPGTMAFTSMMDARGNRGAQFNLGTNFLFLHRGVINPGGGIGAHYHSYIEEMFVILSGEAQFTIDGNTSVLQSPAAAPNRRGSWHAIYNHTDEPIEWMNISVSVVPGVYDAFDLGQDMVDAELDETPQFIHGNFSRENMRVVENYDGGTGPVEIRRAIRPADFFTTWAYLDYIVIPPGSTIGPVSKPDISEVFYVVSGSGEATIGGETVEIGQDYAIPAALHESRMIAAGDEELVLLVIGVARDEEAKLRYMQSPDASIRR